MIAKPLRDARGRFVSPAHKLVENVLGVTTTVDDYKPDPDVWVQFTLSISPKGCGNRTIHSMNTAKGKRSPFASTSTSYGYQQGTPTGGIRLTEVIAYLRNNSFGREIDLAFVHYPTNRSTGGSGKKEYQSKTGTLYNEHFKAHEFMELLDHTPEAKRVNDWFNNNHTPPSHLRSYSIVFHDQRYPVTDEFKEII